MRIRHRLILGFCLVVAAPAIALAQWSADPSENMPIADRTSEQVVPKIAGTSDGGSYVGWYDLSFGQYSICLQRLDANGYELWPHNGILVSAHPQLSYVTDWDLIADSEDNAVLVFSDARDGEDLDVYAYRIDGDGQPLGGVDGVALSANADYEPSPVAEQASDGDLVFAWPRLPDAGGGAIQMQRLTPDGVPRFPMGGLSVVSVPNEDPAFPRLVAAEAGGVIMIWVRDISAYMSPRHLRAQKFSTAGAGIWPAVVNVYDASSVPMGYGPDLYADGADGALVLWHSAPVDMFNSRVQHLSSAGVEIFAHNGLTVSTATTRHHIDPTLSFLPSTGEILVFWNERNPNQSQWGIYGQKLTSVGTRAWGTEGIAFVPVNTVYKYTQRSAPCADGAIAFFITDIGGAGSSHVLGFRVDGAGKFVWPDSLIDISTYPSSKSRLPIKSDAAGVVTLVWEDGRQDFADVYGQNVHPDGRLGVLADVAAEGDYALRLAPNTPNPFSDVTRLALGAGVRGAAVRILDASGRQVRTLVADGVGTILWDGTDDRGQRLPGGVYFYGMAGSGNRGQLQRAVLVR